MNNNLSDGSDVDEMASQYSAVASELTVNTATTGHLEPKAIPTVLWVHVAEGVTQLNLITFYYAVFITIASYTFVNSAQKLVLTDLLGTDEDEIGRATGDLGFYNELVIIAAVAPWGVVSDKIGRKAVYMLGLFFISAGFYLTSYATSFGVLVAYRLVYAVGAAAVAAMLTSVLADYVSYQDKGRASGFMGLFSGCGALLAALILLKIPTWLTDQYGTEAAIHGAYITTATIVLLSAIVLLFGLQNRTVIQKENREVLPWLLLGQGLQSAWQDRELALAFASGFVARGDSVVLTTFLSLWVQDYVRAELGEVEGAGEEAAAQAGMITGIAQTCALIFALVAGYMASRLKGVLSVVIVAFIATVGYGSICFVSDPTSSAGIICACIIGVGEIGVIVTAQSLASKRAPTNLRGSIGGLVGLCGSVGILVCTKAGGALYDDWSPAGPFFLFAIFNGILFIWSLILYIMQCREGEMDFDTAPHEDVETYERLLQVGKDSADTAAMIRAGSRNL